MIFLCEIWKSYVSVKKFRKDKLCSLGTIFTKFGKIKSELKNMHMFKKFSLSEVIDDDALSMLLEFSVN